MLLPQDSTTRWVETTCEHVCSNCTLQGSYRSRSKRCPSSFTSKWHQRQWGFYIFFERFKMIRLIALCCLQPFMLLTARCTEDSNLCKNGLFFYSFIIIYIFGSGHFTPIIHQWITQQNSYYSYPCYTLKTGSVGTTPPF